MTLIHGHVTAYEVPFVEPYVTASVHHEVRKGFLVRLADEHGNVGLGEAAPLGSRTEDHATCHTVLEEAVEALTSANLAPDQAASLLDETAPALAKAPAARFGLELALMDLQARGQGKSLSAWLTDRQGTGTPARRIPVNATLPVMSKDRTVEAAREAVEQGFSTLKLKIGKDELEDDIERLVAVHDAVGPGVDLRIDANQAWMPMQAIEALMDIADAVPIAYVEQPTPGQDARGMVMVREASPIPVAADEPVVSPGAAQHLIELGAADVLILKPMVIGGLSRSLTIAELARDAELDVVVTSTIDGAVARAGALHLAASLPEPPLACGLATAGLLAEAVLPHTETIEDGAMLVPHAPGHGVPIPDPEVSP